jgi:hypothetical protein
VAFDDRVEAASGLDEWTEFGSELSQGFVGQRLLCGAHRSVFSFIECRKCIYFLFLLKMY